MAKISKNRKAVLAKYDLEKEYSLEDAAKMLKEITFTKFDASVDVDILWVWIRKNQTRWSAV